MKCIQWKCYITHMITSFKDRALYGQSSSLIQLRHCVHDKSTGFDGIYKLLPMFDGCNESEGQHLPKIWP